MSDTNGLAIWFKNSFRQQGLEVSSPHSGVCTQTFVDNVEPRPKTLPVVMKRRQPEQKADTTPGGNPTGATRFALAQFPKYRGWRASAAIPGHRYQEFLSQNSVNIMVVGQNGPFTL